MTEQEYINVSDPEFLKWLATLPTIPGGYIYNANNPETNDTKERFWIKETLYVEWKTRINKKP